MKDVLSNANFPQDAQGRTYHVATKVGQVANRIITVGDQVRAHRIAKAFDGGKPLFEFSSQRNFLTLTGTFQGVPISIVAIGMGFSVVDFFVRECRAVVEGEMIIVRLGSCGSLQPEYGIGTVVVPKASFGISRNYDYFHHDTTADERRSGALEPYLITKPLDADQEVHDALLAALEADKPKNSADLFGGEEVKAAGDTVNASADSFYGSQGRIDPAFVDANVNLIDVIRERRPGVATLEMETFLLNHLAAAANDAIDLAEKNGEQPVHKGKIRTGAVQMIFANRNTSAFISPEQCETLEHWAGKSVLTALANIQIPNERLHPTGVWNQSA
ncbi:purine and uridine phosphorylase [Moesziomyces antarcticus]|uniref:Purine and uridine phosphorylase n=2 Tax=Pseudozyma antarctica TaxID=84753 RepID=A0A081CFY2_PSEA2|nr:purine and uridine phosphorylase [Moesziomyces antarcticus]GAK65578.1 purine and uridine phosphorylase [Moesziomyces antarcticus]SPO46593.1 related to Purine-nucleoside phosphorylase [Moesziomyces antarcticus]